MKPIILVVATSRWFPTARLVMALHNAGCVVDAVCPTEHPLGLTRAARQVYSYAGLTPLRSISAAIAISKPDLVIPGDDLAARHLHHLHRKKSLDHRFGAETCALLQRSLGCAESFAVVDDRPTFIRIAEEENVRVPKTGVIANVEGVRQWVSQAGCPVVLKANGTSGGYGVRIANSVEEAESAFVGLHAPPLLARAAKRALVDRDKSLIWPSLARHHQVVSAQTFVHGREATSTVACWNGKVLAALHFEVVKMRYNAGPASVMRLIDNPEISSAVEKMVRRLKLSGLQGFDFMIEAATGQAYLIEINPRTTQVGHLSLGPGRDLSAALCAAVSGTEIRPAPTATTNDTIALFPQEWMRDPASSYLKSAYHDVPWEEPRLLRACIQQGQKQHLSMPKRQWEQSLAPAREPHL